MHTFTDWLAMQSHRPDAIGWLALNHMFDPTAADNKTVADVAQHMRDVGASQAAQQALAQAAEEYKQAMPSNVIIFRRPAEMGVGGGSNENSEVL